MQRNTLSRFAAGAAATAVAVALSVGTAWADPVPPDPTPTETTTPTPEPEPTLSDMADGMPAWLTVVLGGIVSALMGAFSYALDLTDGQPPGHCVRCCWIFSSASCISTKCKKRSK